MDSGVDFKAADMPHADRFRLHLEAVIAEDERRRISERTKAALAAAKRRGVKLGSPSPQRAGLVGAAAMVRQADLRAANTAPIIQEIRRAGITTMAGIAQALNARGVDSPRGRTWGASQVWRVLQRSELV